MKEYDLLDRTFNFRSVASPEAAFGKPTWSSFWRSRTAGRIKQSEDCINRVQDKVLNHLGPANSDQRVLLLKKQEIALSEIRMKISREGGEE
jgi:hypothetical protein